MNITCTTEKLKNAVSLAERMTGKALTLPTLHAILLIASDNSITIRSTNLALGIEIEIPATVEVAGTVLIKGEVLASVCSHLNDATEVNLSLDHDNLHIQTPQHSTVIKCLPPDEFPTLPIVEGDQIEIKTSILQEGIRSVYFCAAVTDIKPEIASIFIYSEENTLCFVATDSFRLAEKKIIVKGIPEISKILIPFKNIADILRVLDVAPETIRITYSRNQIAFSANGIYLTSRLIDGGFPPYQLIIPKETLTKVVVLKQELLNTLRLSTIFADKFFQVSFSIPEDKKGIMLTSKNSDVGSVTSIVSAAIEGEPIEVECNLKYFLDVFQALHGDSMIISFTQSNKPIIIRSVSDTSFLYLLMPANR
jgi:DNA polymerase-3 subunit beta